MRIGLTAYGTVFSMGLAPQAGRPRIKPIQLLERAGVCGLAGAELPAVLLEGEDIDAVARYAREHHLFLNLATGGYAPEKLAETLELGARLGVETVRTVVGGAQIGGDRRLIANRWSAFLEEMLEGLGAATQVAERVGVNLTVENHQDLASEELLWLCNAIDSSRFGITLDTGNPLATAEEPLDFVRRIGTHLKNVHLKDYWIFPTDEGYRLARSPIGQGVIDFPQLFAMVRELCPDITMSLEMGALEARHIRVLADDYWPAYPPRSAAQLAHVLRFVYAHVRQSENWQTPFERHEPAEAIVAYEEQQLRESVAYLKQLIHA
ncbi:sugar phosphate isomerase/epimerase family protein [Ktedonobacter racemifer]|uniref:Xylose isomerase domain protein TIM barrel n=1 Tax=Ktedonobacter racemifer DSM 44963 TaxID=485913 RepID=D6TWX1_KTERA|nr:sugar phosphate isomerase/epimerase [Ktedonobacter racemifer]EFH84704.1 Xylose isomerase domain protein TIM barrel [Ktedonobacter racemifer DSM 44963]